MIYFPEPSSVEPIQLLDELVAMAREGQLPPWCLPSNLYTSKAFVSELRRRSFYEGFWTGMAWSTQPTQPIAIPHLACREIVAESDLSHWLDIVGPHLLGKDATDTHLFRYLFHQDETQFFLGYENGRPVGAAMLFHENAVTGMYFLVTHPDHRKKGVGRLMVNHLQWQTWEKNTGIMVLQATKEGLSLYDRTGFRRVAPISMFNLLHSDLPVPESTENP